MNTGLRFPRANRNDCTRNPNPIQGPYSDGDWLDNPLAWLVCGVVLVGVVAYSGRHLLPWFQ